MATTMPSVRPESVTARRPLRQNPTISASAELRIVTVSTMLQLSLLGPPKVAVDGAPVSFDTRKAVALLAVLAVEARPQPRDRLAALLWPDADAARARSALRRTLSVTAAAVGDALVVDRSLLGIDAAKCWCDVNAFRDLAAGSSVHDLRAAVKLYRDDFLAGFVVRGAPAYDDWHGHHADALQRVLAEALARLVDAHIGSGDLDVALADAQRWLSLDPLHEPAHHALIRILAWQGQRSAAMRQYRACVRVLDSELGVAPLEETTQLYDTVRRGTLPPPETAAATVASAEPALASYGDTAYVGRDVEVTSLGQAMARAADGRGIVAVVSGPPGIGKTTLLRRAAHQPDRFFTVSVRCHPEEAGLAYGAVTELARGLVSAVPDALTRLARPVRAELARLLPEVADLEGPANGDDPAAMVRLYAAARELLAAAGRPVALVVDDADWLDPASGELLAYLVRRLDSLPLAVLLAWTTDSPSDPTPLERAVTDAVEGDTGIHLVLRPFDVGEVERLVAADPTVGEIDVTSLVAETGGIPAAVVAYVEAVRRGDDPVGVTTGVVRQTLARRTGRLSETGRQVLAAAVILGGRIDPEVVRETSGRGDAETVAALEEAVSAGLFVERPSGDGYDLASEAVRAVVTDGLTVARRRLLHQRAGRALARRAGAGQVTAAEAGAIAHHLQEAGETSEAADWHWRAAVAAQELHAHEEALTQVRSALELGTPTPTGRLAEAESLTALGRYGEAIAALEVAAAAATDDRQAAAIERRLADVHHRLGDYAAADGHLLAALDVLGPDDANAVRITAERALLAYRLGSPDEAEQHVQAALELADRIGDGSSVAYALNVRGMLAASRDDVPSAECSLRESLKQAGRHGDADTEIAALNNLARLLSRAGRNEEALEMAEAALERGVRLADRHRLAALHTNLADLLRASGQDDQSMDHLKQAAALFADVDEDPLRRPEIWTLVEW